MNYKFRYASIIDVHRANHTALMNTYNMRVNLGCAFAPLFALRLPKPKSHFSRNQYPGRAGEQLPLLADLSHTSNSQLEGGLMDKHIRPMHVVGADEKCAGIVYFGLLLEG